MCFLDVSHQIDGVVSSRRLFSPPIPSEKMNIQRFTISAKWETPLQIRYIFRPSQSNKQQQVLLIGSKTSCIYATSIYILKTTSCEVNSHFNSTSHRLAGIIPFPPPFPIPTPLLLFLTASLPYSGHDPLREAIISEKCSFFEHCSKGL